MTTAQLVFLYTAEELNISRAAKRAFVSQQAASTHIKKLEASYGLPLFHRKPSLSLTEAGESLYSACRQMQLLEQSTDSRIAEIREGNAGLIRVGMNSARSRLLIPNVLKEYRTAYPKVQVDFRFGDTFSLIDQLKTGELDLIVGIGINPEELSNLIITPVSADTVYFLTTEEQLEAFAPEIAERLSAAPETPASPASADAAPSPAGPVISLHDLASFPMCRNNRGSTLTTLIDQKLAQEGVLLQDLYFISDYDTQLSLCRENIASCFCPSMLLRRVDAENASLTENKRILSFRVAEIQDTLSVDLIRLKYVFHPRYMERFTECLMRSLL